ncbi:MAG: hypothetical protein AB4063_07865 [Crocosphaera sp.]
MNNQEIAKKLFTAFSIGDFSEIPEIKVLSDDVLGSTDGAYAPEKNKIYLNERFLRENIDNTHRVDS